MTQEITPYVPQSIAQGQKMKSKITHNERISTVKETKTQNKKEIKMNINTQKETKT